MKKLVFFLSLLFITGLSFGQTPFTDSAVLKTFIRDTIKDRRPEKVSAAQIQRALIGTVHEGHKSLKDSLAAARALVAIPSPRIPIGNGAGFTSDSNFTFQNSTLTVTVNNLLDTGAHYTKGIVLENNTPSDTTSGGNQNSPSLIWKGTAYYNEPGDAQESRVMQMKADVRYLPGISAHPKQLWQLKAKEGSNGWGAFFGVDTEGRIYINGVSVGEPGQVITSNGASGGAAWADPLNPSIPNTQIAYGDGSDQLTSSSNFVVNDGIKFYGSETGFKSIDNSTSHYAGMGTNGAGNGEFLINNGGGTGKIRIPDLADDQIWTMPPTGGTLALTSDIPAAPEAAIPLSGTASGFPVTGKIVQFPPGGLGAYYTEYRNNSDALAGFIGYTGDEVVFRSINTGSGATGTYNGGGVERYGGGWAVHAYDDTYQSTMQINPDGFIITSDAPLAHGLSSDVDFTANITDLDYTQKKYVDSVVAGASDAPYKVYTALLTQTGTDAPTATVLQNTVGDVVWTRFNQGIYRITLTDAFITSKVFIVYSGLTNTSAKPVVMYTDISSDFIEMTIDPNNEPIDDQLTNYPVEIRVYP